MNHSTQDQRLAIPSPQLGIVPSPHTVNMPLMCSPVGAAPKVLTSVGSTRRVPCKARGVPGDHNIQTAFFDIPLDAKHGMILVCSHPGCSGSGRRFRYCAVCEVPVAKRNFMKRHAHGLVKSSRSSGGGSAAAILTDDVAAPPAAALAGSKHRRSVSIDAAECLDQAKLQNVAETTVQSTQQGALPREECAVAPIASRQPMVAPTLSNVPTVSTAPTPTGTYDPTVMTMQLNSAEFQWLALLHNRPSIEDTAAMNKWMESVLQQSEPTTNVPSVTPPSWSDNESLQSLESSAAAQASMGENPTAEAHAAVGGPRDVVVAGANDAVTAPSIEAVAAVMEPLSLNAEVQSDLSSLSPTAVSTDLEAMTSAPFPALKRQRTSESSSTEEKIVANLLSDWNEQDMKNVFD